jgi:hypothetical protein
VPGLLIVWFRRNEIAPLQRTTMGLKPPGFDSMTTQDVFLRQTNALVFDNNFQSSRRDIACYVLTGLLSERPSRGIPRTTSC